MAEPSSAAVPPPPASATVSDPSAAFAEHIPSNAPTVERTPVGSRYIWLFLLGQFGTFFALVTPIAISLAIQVQRLAPQNEEFLGYVLALGSAAAVLTGPFAGMFSDRTRSRFGRRRPWLVGSALLGLLGLAVIALAPTVVVVAIGWVLTQMGLGTTGLILFSCLADRLPEEQRGRVAGLQGVVMMLAPILGAGLGGTLATQTVALFLVPGVVGVVLVLVFVFLVPEPDTREMPVHGRLTVGAVFGNYVFNPARYPDFSWNWAGRFLFNIGVTFSTSFTAFFFAAKLGLPVTEIGGLVAISGLLGAVATMGGALSSGFLSDRLKRRKPFVLGSGLIFALGAVVMATSPGLVMLFVGMFLANLGLGVFSAVDQALVLDVLPERDTEAGRFNGINQFSNTIPQAIAPAIAPVFLAIGATSSGNYSLLYLVAAGFTILGGLVVLRVRSVR